jgi:alkanesulfonate monooxygenase SsuD/methylene tetrahydromethanopterin reductase-like flavin-dependent oxidoreductase (luciferase family)
MRGQEISMSETDREQDDPHSSAAALAIGSVSLRLYRHELPARELIDELCQQASLAVESGFDGVMTNEHHGGFPTYLPNPTQVAGFALASMRRGWAAPCPLLLPLKHWSHVAEDLAWLSARYPGRVGAGFAVGGLDLDFELADLPWKERWTRFRTALPSVVDVLSGRCEGELSSDPAIAACTNQPLPMVMAAQGERSAKLGAGLGLGLIYDSLQPPESIGQLSKLYRSEGGTGRLVLIRRVWLGPPPDRAAESQVAFYKSFASQQAQSTWVSDELMTEDSPELLAERLVEAVEAAQSDALNLRLHAQGVGPAAIRAQIETIGREVIPRLRAAWRA